MREALIRWVGEDVSHGERVIGGDINEVFRVFLPGGGTRIVKHRPGAPPDFFEAETYGLRALRDAGALRVPEVHRVFADALVLEDLGPATGCSDASAEAFGRGLASLHRCVGDGPGLARDGYIGSLRQSNAAADRWSEFFFLRRIAPFARAAGLIKEADALRPRLGALLGDPAASLLHGDLWSGNAHFGEGGPALIDPAVYHGDREIDLAMMELFGGFPARLWRSYEEAWPLQPGWEERRALFQLPPLLVHAVMFGGSYTSRAQAIMHRFA
ncbi:MAG: fructosamine kinase family protein [Myxococcota bacterium]